MKKVLCLVLVISLVTLGLVGCGGTSKSTPADNTTPEQAAAPDKTYKIRIAHVLQESTPTHKALVEFKNYVEEKSAGKISVEVYPNSSLGGERQICEAVQLGTLESALATTAVLANFEPKLTVFELPFLYNTLDIARKSVDGEFGKLATEGLNKVKIMNLAIMENGFRYITNSKRPIHTPKDLNGIKIRTMENPIHMETFRLLGASPTPMAFNELYTALQQKTVDGQENPVFLTYSSKFYEVQKYLSLTGHIYAAAPFVMNLDFLIHYRQICKQLLKMEQMLPVINKEKCLIRRMKQT